MIKAKISFLTCVLCAAAASIVVGCKSTDQGGASNSGGASTGSEISNTSTQKAQFLFVQNAKEVTFHKGVMTLHGVNPVTVCFTDRPDRIAGHMPTSKIVPMWFEGKNSFTADPPNATLSIFNGDSVSNFVLVLRDPHLSGDDLLYNVHSLEGIPPARGGACSLFIDVIGMPLTPNSYAGAARRAYRAGYAYPGVYRPAVVPVAPIVRPAVIY